MNYVEKQFTFCLTEAYHDCGFQQAKFVVSGVRRQSAAMLWNCKKKTVLWVNDKVWGGSQ